MFHLGIDRISPPVYNCMFLLLPLSAAIVWFHFKTLMLCIFTFTMYLNPYVFNCDYDSKGYKRLPSFLASV